MYREVSTMVGDHMGVPRTVVFVFYYAPKQGLGNRDFGGSNTCSEP
jgi:hypothetical protein